MNNSHGFLGAQSRIEKGHRAEENQVSSTSSSLLTFSLPYFLKTLSSSSVTSSNSQVLIS